MDNQIRTEGKFQYIEHGEGPILMLLHGLFGELSNFEEVISRFSSSYKVVVPLLPIYDLPVRETNVGSLAVFVSEFIQAKGYNDITLLGNSLGGHVALVCSSEYPDGIKSLVLTGSSGLYENSFGDGYPRKGDKEYLRKKIEITFYNPEYATDQLVDECYEAVNNRHKLIRILCFAKSAIRHNMAKDLPNINIPTCLIWGKNDQITPPEVAEEFNRILPNANLFWIDECGHAPMMEKPTEFNDILAAYLEKQAVS